MLLAGSVTTDPHGVAYGDEVRHDARALDVNIAEGVLAVLVLPHDRTYVLGGRVLGLARGRERHASKETWTTCAVSDG